MEASCRVDNLLHGALVNALRGTVLCHLKNFRRDLQYCQVDNLLHGALQHAILRIDLDHL